MKRDAALNTLQIRTSEGVYFSLPLAGPITRFCALGIDTAALAVVQVGIGLFLVSIGAVLPAIGIPAAILTQYIISMGYFVLLEGSFRGQTLGKRVMKLRVMDAEGLRLRLDQVVLRNLLRTVDMLPGLYLVGGISVVVSPQCRRLGDIAAGTVVIREEAVPEPAVSSVIGVKYNSFRDYPHIEARLRQRVSPAQRALALQAIVRRDEFEPEARLALFHEMAETLREAVRFPEAATVGLTDEQYVRNALDSIFRSGPRAGKSGATGLT